MDRLMRLFSGLTSRTLTCDNVADLQGVLHLLEAAVGDVGDVNQTVKAGFQLDERAEGHDADDTALDDGAGGVASRPPSPTAGPGVCL